jgi:hypothetical protein
MTDGPYEIVRTEHNIDWESDGGWPVPDRFFLYVYTVRARRWALAFEGLKTLVRAVVGPAVRSAPPSLLPERPAD